MTNIAKGRSLWILMLLALVASTTIASVLSTESVETLDVTSDEWDEGFEEDYSGEDETSEVTSEYNGSSQQQQPTGGAYPSLPQLNSYNGQVQYQPQYPQQYPQQVSSYQSQAPQYQQQVSQYQQQVPQYQQQVPQYQPQVTTYQQANYTVEYQPLQQVYQQQSYQTPVQSYQPTYQQQQVYQAAPLLKTSNYSVQVKPAYVQTTVRVYSNYSQPAQYSASSLSQKYGLTDLASFTTPFGYRSNHPSLHYYRFLDHTVCPKQNGVYRFPTPKDVEYAFSFAIGNLQGYQANGGLNYLNMSTPTFAARHQIASYLSRKNARMDEEGLLVELVSSYLADRLCLTKWDRQRYLPSLTKFVSSGNFPNTHSCSQYYSPQRNQWQGKNCYQNKYRTYDGFCNNPYHPYWGKSDVCHIRLLSPDYADGIKKPRSAHNGRYELPNPRLVANTIHSDVPLDGPYNLMKMQWGQFINHDITNTALSAYDGLVDCCKSRNARGCWPIMVLPGDRFYGPLNVTCLNFIRSAVCPLCQLGPRQQTNKNTAFIDASHVYGNTHEQAQQLRAFVGGLLKTSSGRNGEQLLPISTTQEQCFGVCYKAGDSRVNQHPALTALHVLLLRNHNRHASELAKRHSNWNDELVFQEARRLNIAEYQMITYSEYLPIVFGPILSAYYKLTPGVGHTYYNYKVDPTTWNEYSTAACRFGHSQISSLFSLTTRLMGYGQQQKDESFRLKDWFFRPSLLAEGKTQQLLTGLLGRPALAVDPWVTTDVRNYLYKSPKEHWGGDLAATNIWRGRDHGLPGYVHYVEYCFNFKVRGWKDLSLFIPPYTLNQLRRLYKVVENIDLFTGGLSERHFPGADIGPTFACINGIQYYHLKFGDRFYFEHANEVGSFTPVQLQEIKRSTLARLLCRAGYLSQVPQYAFLQASNYNPLLNCSQISDFNYNLF